MKKSTFGSVFSFAKECRVKLVFSVLSAILSVFCGLVPYLGAYKIIMMFFDERQNVSGILMWIGISAGGYLLKLAFYGLSTVLSHMSAYKILESMRLALCKKLMRQPLGDVMAKTAGQLKSIIVDRVETIELPLAHMIPEGISNLLLPLFVFGYMIHINPAIAFASLICVPIGAAVYAVMMRSYNSQYDKFMKASAHVNSVIVEYVEGIQVIKAFNRSSSSYEKFTSAVKDFRDFTLDWFRSTWGFMNLGNAILPSTLLGIFPVGVLLYINGALTPAELTLSIILSMSIIAPVSWFTVAVNDYKSIQYAVNDVNEVLDSNELSESKERVHLSRYDIKLKNVSFSYNNSNVKAVDNVTLTLPEGSFTALAGPSGGGKSTVARLIARFWDVAEGEITIGGKNIRGIPFSQLSEIISYVTQDNFLFNCSILENIRLGNPKATDEQVYAAARAAQCDEFINKLEKGYHSSAGEAGGKLSGGERQRIAIARAILKNAPIVILDEATAFTDPENEAALQRSIAELTKGKTLLVIAHRLSTIKNADNIVLLENGRVSNQGNQSQLLEKSELYKKMWSAHIGTKGWAAGGEKNV
ncbi:MAG: ABC transporter ATP-binding protein [Oscillospiraceae bacterium]